MLTSKKSLVPLCVQVLCSLFRIDHRNWQHNLLFTSILQYWEQNFCCEVRYTFESIYLTKNLPGGKLIEFSRREKNSCDLKYISLQIAFTWWYWIFCQICSPQHVWVCFCVVICSCVFLFPFVFLFVFIFVILFSFWY